MTFRGPQKLEQWPSRDGPFTAVRRFAPAPARVEGGDGHDLPGTTELRAVALPERPRHRRAPLRSRYIAGRGRRRTRPSPSAWSIGGTRWTAPSLGRSRPGPREPGVLAAAPARTPGVRRRGPGEPPPATGVRHLVPGGPDGDATRSPVVGGARRAPSCRAQALVRLALQRPYERSLVRPVPVGTLQCCLRSCVETGMLSLGSRDAAPLSERRQTGGLPPSLLMRSGDPFPSHGSALC